MIILLIFILTAFSDSFGQKPDYDFYAHPLIEEFQHKSNYISGKLVKYLGQEDNWYEYILKAGDKKFKVYSDRFYKKGSFVIASEDYVISYDRRIVLFLLFGIYFLIFLLFARKVGFKILFSFIFLFLLMVVFFIPYLKHNFSPILISIIFSFISSLIFAFSIFGINRKSYSVIIGIFSGLFFTLLIVFLYWRIAKLNGFSDSTIQLLNYTLRNYFNLNFKNLGNIILSGIIFSCAGLMLDIVVDVASYMFEAEKVNPEISKKELFNSGMNVGKDVLVAICNALLFAYFGVELFNIMGKTLSIKSTVLLLNMEWFSIEILKFFPVILGFVVAIIVTSYSFLLFKKTDFVIIKK